MERRKPSKSFVEINMICLSWTEKTTNLAVFSMCRVAKCLG